MMSIREYRSYKKWDRNSEAFRRQSERNRRYRESHPLANTENSRKFRRDNPNYRRDKFYRDFLDRGIDPPEYTIRSLSQLESLWRETLKSLCGDIFIYNIRPDWLRNPDTGRSLELDLFHKHSLVAIEVELFSFDDFNVLISPNVSTIS